MAEALKDMVARLNTFIIGRELNGSDKKILDDLEELIEDHQTRWRRRGVKFPDMTALVIPRLGFLKLVRQDWDASAIDVEILNLTVQCPEADAEELATAVHYAWPDHLPRMDSRGPAPVAKKTTLIVDADGVREEGADDI